MQQKIPNRQESPRSIASHQTLIIMKKAYALIGILLTSISTTLLLAEEEREGNKEEKRANVKKKATSKTT